VQQDLISIVIAVYNTKGYINKCVSSIINQTFRKIEIILVDDGSTDGSGAICDRYALVDSRIQVIHQENKGVSAARKAGLAIASGQYVGFVDADDFLERDCIEAMYNGISDSDVDFMHFGFMQIYKDGEAIPYVNFPDILIHFINDEQRERFIKKYILDNKNTLAFGVVLKIYKREFIQGVYAKVPDYIKLGEDAICFVYAIKNCSSFAARPLAKYYYFMRDVSASHLLDMQYRINAYHFAHELLMTCEQCGFSSLSDDAVRFFQQVFYKVCVNEGVDSKGYFFRNKDVLFNKKIYIYGAGLVGLDFLTDFIRDRRIELMGIVDRDWENIRRPMYDVQPIEILKSAAFDYVVVAIYNAAVADDIIQDLCQLGIPREQILYQKPMRVWEF
jgi:glycosyltransferase involved in cell wall biosynthesis